MSIRYEPHLSIELPLENAVVLLWLESDTLERVREANLIRLILAKVPLAVVIGGHGSERFFDALLTAIDRTNPVQTIMTNFVAMDANAAAADFLSATWPSEDRFSEWRYYVVLTFGEAHDLRHALAGLVDS